MARRGRRRGGGGHGARPRLRAGRHLRRQDRPTLPPRPRDLRRRVLAIGRSDERILGVPLRARARLRGRGGLRARRARLLTRWRIARFLLPGASLALFAFVYVGQKFHYPRSVVFGALAFTALVAMANRGGGGARARPTSPRGVAAFVFVAETTSLVWGGWLLSINNGRPSAFVATFLALAFAGVRVRSALDRGGSALSYEAIGGLPLLALPLLGLMRSPSLGWVIGAIVVGAGLRAVGRRYRTRVPDWSVPLAALGPASIFVIPLGLRSLPTVSLKDHEAQHMGWINSALHGKLLMADAGTIYGPVREYLMTAWCLFAGTTVLQVRISFILLNLIGLGILLAVGWKHFGRSALLLAWFAVALLIYTPSGRSSPTRPSSRWAGRTSRAPLGPSSPSRGP